MSDIFHVFGSDLTIGATGDLGTISGALAGQQRLMRRLLTNPGDYIWQLDYGAGLARFIGEPTNTAHISAVISGQIFKEPSVSRTPAPNINVQISPAGAAGSVYLDILYADAQSDETQVMSFPVNM